MFFIERIKSIVWQSDPEGCINVQLILGDSDEVHTTILDRTHGAYLRSRRSDEQEFMVRYLACQSLLQQETKGILGNTLYAATDLGVIPLKVEVHVGVLGMASGCLTNMDDLNQRDKHALTERYKADFRLLTFSGDEEHHIASECIFNDLEAAIAYSANLLSLSEHQLTYQLAEHKATRDSVLNYTPVTNGSLL